MWQELQILELRENLILNIETPLPQYIFFEIMLNFKMIAAEGELGHPFLVILIHYRPTNNNSWGN